VVAGWGGYGKRVREGGGGVEPKVQRKEIQKFNKMII